jgi:hypothetical protein
MSISTRAIIFLGLLILVGAMSDYQHQAPVFAEGRFVKLDAAGKHLNPWQGPWACILDTQTGLVWENKTDDESIHDALWTYSWYIDEKGVENTGDCFFEENRCDTSDLIRRVEAKQLCGLSEWRLPSAAELQTLVFDLAKTGDAKIEGDFFAHTQRGDYWTSDAGIALEGVYAHLGEGAIAIDFIEGAPRSIPYRNAAFVRLVSTSIIK